MSETKNPANAGETVQGQSTTFREHFITDNEIPQAFESAKRFLAHTHGTEGKETYEEGYLTLISYLAGYASNMPLYVAHTGAIEILHERYGMKL